MSSSNEHRGCSLGRHAPVFPPANLPARNKAMLDPVPSPCSTTPVRSSPFDLDPLDILAKAGFRFGDGGTHRSPFRLRWPFLSSSTAVFVFAGRLEWRVQPHSRLRLGCHPQSLGRRLRYRPSSPSRRLDFQTWPERSKPSRARARRSDGLLSWMVAYTPSLPARVIAAAAMRRA